eukprot:765099-Hanusia_phi.AAC.6
MPALRPSSVVAKHQELETGEKSEQTTQRRLVCSSLRFRTSCIVDEAVVPCPLTPGSKEAGAIPRIAQEGVGIAGDVDLNGRSRVSLVEEQQSLLDVLLPDIPVRSLSTGNVVPLDSDALLSWSCTFRA